MIINHLHWKFMCGTPTITPGVFNDVTWVTVNGNPNEVSALEEVKTIIQRPTYHLNEVWQCSQCDLMNQQLKTQKDYFKRMLKMQGLEKRPWEKKDDDETTEAGN